MSGLIKRRTRKLVERVILKEISGLAQWRWIGAWKKGVVVREKVAGEGKGKEFE